MVRIGGIEHVLILKIILSLLFFATGKLHTPEHDMNNVLNTILTVKVNYSHEMICSINPTQKNSKILVFVV